MIANFFGNRALVEQPASNGQPTDGDGQLLGAGFMFAGRQTKPLLRLFSCRFSSTT